TEESDPRILRQRVLDYKEQNNRDLVAEVSTPVQYVWSQSIPVLPPGSEPDLHVVLYDFGIKYNTLRFLTARSCRITVVPHQTTASEVLNLQPDGILLSNGPGDPQDLIEVIPNIQSLLGKIPIFGICLGHQLLAMALGFSTFKLKFGHRGGNHPVKDLATGKVEITSQNHGYCVELSGERDGTTVTHINLNDGTLEGLANKELNCFSVQYHPEAAPGPHDAEYLFERFINLINENRTKGVGFSA
ncbi:MAG: carbamoyl phosphate synthase small subunit, partial [Dethiobacteria bacterium]|nr:carbamoyl phosphate synthase small subunit [Dethiobacteria bacterium]